MGGRWGQVFTFLTKQRAIGAATRTTQLFANGFEFPGCFAYLRLSRPRFSFLVGSADVNAEICSVSHSGGSGFVKDTLDVGLKPRLKM